MGKMGVPELNSHPVHNSLEFWTKIPDKDKPLLRTWRKSLAVKTPRGQNRTFSKQFSATSFRIETSEDK